MNVSRYSKQLPWLFSAAFLSYLAYRILLVFSIQPDLGGVENAVVYFIQRSLAGMPLYTDPELSPFAINQYGPLYYLLTTSIGKLWGTDPGQVQDVFILNRTVSLVLNLAMATLITRICTRIFLLKTATGLAAGVMSFIFLEITSFARPDSLNHLLYFFSIYYFLRSRQKTSTLLLVASAFFAVAAIFTKQSSFTLPLIAAIWMWYGNKRNFQWTWFIAYGIFFIVALLLLHLYAGLPVIYQNLVEGVNNGINLGLFWGNIIKPFFTSFGLLWIPLAFLVYKHTKKAGSDTIRFLSLAMILQLAISLVLSLKFGSHVNYFTEFWTLLFIAIACYWNSLLKISDNYFPSFPAFMLGMILLIKISVISFPLYRETRFGNADRKVLYEKEKLVAGRILSAGPGQKVFNNLFSPHSFLNNFLFRQAILPQYEIVYFTTWDRGIYNYDQFRNELNNGSIPWIITRQDDVKFSFKDFTIGSYQQVSDTVGYRILHFEGTGIK